MACQWATLKLLLITLFPVQYSHTHKTLTPVSVRDQYSIADYISPRQQHYKADPDLIPNHLPWHTVLQCRQEILVQTLLILPYLFGKANPLLQ